MLHTFAQNFHSYGYASFSLIVQHQICQQSAGRQNLNKLSNKKKTLRCLAPTCGSLTAKRLTSDRPKAV